ncbi:NUDIX domain-containing protein [Pseudonocardiaceae bacterium YIM PH 21723]|nr:NUDIX domain-containing protein [Pseudonocardiaceae bacterium YIM PH 21723]
MIDSSVLEQLTTDARNDGVEQLVVGAIVRDEDNVLLLKRPADDFMGGIFELPSGKVEGDEGLVPAVLREVEEETGLIVTDIDFHVGNFDYTSGSGKKSRQFNFAVSVAEITDIKLSEHDTHVWVSLSDELPVTDAVKEIFEEYKQMANLA